jgi:hypothetical protein
MTPIKKIITTISIFCFISIHLFSQDDMLNLLDSIDTKKTHDKTIATFKGSKIINAQTIETVKKRTMDFNITHRFGNIGEASNGGAHTLYGLDNVADVRIGFDFGITDNITLGVGRSSQNELIDGFIKYRFLCQTTDNHIPFSIAVYSDMSYNPQSSSQFYRGAIETSKRTELQRVSYTTQLIIARKFGWRFSMELLPSYQHRNFVVGVINPDNGSEETNGLYSIGVGGRLKITQRFAIIGDYFYTFSDYRNNNSENPFFAPLALGFEIDTGGHIFHLMFSNSAGIIENNYIPHTTDDWLKGGFKFGFNISRVFGLGGKKKGTLNKKGTDRKFTGNI